MPAVPLLVGSLGAVNALGYMVPILIAGDIFSVIYYKKHADKNSIKKLIPFALAGIIIGMVTGNHLSGDSFNRIIASLIIISLVIILINQNLLKKGANLNIGSKAGSSTFLSKTGPVFSLATGFVSMLGGAGGPVISTYNLITNISKNAFIGTTAWFFFFVNLMKLPLYLFVWKNISTNSLITDLYLLPITALGILSGIYIVKKINEKAFKTIIFTVTFFSALKLFF
jgi:uncharacterized membrane protein YfcA